MNNAALEDRLVRWAPALIVATLLAAVYLAWAPHTADLAGQTARGDLFDRSGITPYWAGWYAGIPTASYSLATPALLGWLGAVSLGAVAIVATGLVAVPLLRDAHHPTAGAIGFVLAAGLDVISGRATFAVGVVFALAAVLATERSRSGLALLLGILATVSSPVAGVLLLIVALTLLLADPERRGSGVAAGIGVLLALGAIAWLSRGAADAGYEPFTRTSLLMAVGTAAVVVAVPLSVRVRVGAAVTIGCLLTAYFVHSPIGANATRIVVLAAAPTVLAATVLTDRRLLIAAVVVTALLPFAQLHNDLSASRTADTSRQFSAPLLRELAAMPVARRTRVEVVDTATHWPSTYLVPHVALARGWERQVDESRNPMFYGRAPLTPATYRRFLDRNAVGVVAVATGVSLDSGATREAALVGGGLPYLRPIWRNDDWRLYAVSRPTPLVTPPAVVTSLDDTGVTLAAPRAGRYLVRLHWSPYLVVTGGKVKHAPHDLVAVTVGHAGRHRVHAQWTWR
jgi:hypothetical protein